MADAENHRESEELKSLEARWRQEGTPRLLLKLSDEYRAQGRLKEAVELLEEGVGVHPDYLAARIALGRCRLDLGRPAAAARALEWVVRHDPTQLVANKLLVRAYIDLAEPAKARDRLEFYSLLNESDQEIATLSRAIGGLEGATPEEARSPAAGDDENAHPDEPLIPIEVEWPAPSMAPSMPLDGGTGPRPHGGILVYRSGSLGDTPFPALLHLDGARHMASLLAERLLPSRAPRVTTGAAVAERAVAERAVAAQEWSAPAFATEPGAEQDEPASILAEAEPPPTPTLAQLYLDQGHLADAEAIYRRVLKADPESRAARAGLEAIAHRRAGEPLRATDLLHDAPGDLTPKGRKIWALSAYLRRLRTGI